MEKHYESLGLEITATLKEVKEKYNQLIDEFNPKKQEGALKDFFIEEQDKVKDAYKEILEDIIELNEKNEKEEVIIKDNEIEEDTIIEHILEGHKDDDVLNESEVHDLGDGLDDQEVHNDNVVRSNNPKRIFSSIVSFNGRIRRREYGLSCIIFYIYIFIIVVGEKSVYYYNYCQYPLYKQFILIVPFILFLFAQGAKRSHDIGRSGWMQLIPLYNPFILIFTDGEIGDNEYGSNPKGLNSN